MDAVKPDLLQPFGVMKTIPTGCQVQGEIVAYFHRRNASRFRFSVLVAVLLQTYF